MSAEWQFLVELNDRILPLKNPVEIQETAVRLLGEHLVASRVNYAQIEGDEFVILRSYADGATPLPTRGPVAGFGAFIVAACRRGETIAVDDVRAEGRLADVERDWLLARGIAGLVGVPLIKGGRWVATFDVHSGTPRAWRR